MLRKNVYYLIKSTRPFTSVNTCLAIEAETSSKCENDMVDVARPEVMVRNEVT